MSASASVDSSLLLWFLAALMYWLAAHLALGGMRDARRDASLGGMRSHLLIAGAGMGTALCAGFVIALSSLGLRLLLGFRADAGAALWLTSMLGALAIASWVALRPGRTGWVLGGLGLALLATGLQAGWLAAAGFRPGVVWSGKYIVAAAVLMAIGSMVALQLAFSEGAQRGRLRLRWRLAASVLLALTWVLGQEVMIAGAGLGKQVGSLYQQQLTAPLLSLVAGTLVPLALLLAGLDQMQRRRQRRQPGRSRAQGVATGQAEDTSPGTLPAALSTQADTGPRRRRRYKLREI